MYTNAQCTGPALAVLGAAGGSNVQTTQIANTDTDADGCTDFQELGSTAGLGGLRDPFNKWDYFDTNVHPTATPVL